jgi:hypothetical protein
MLNPVVKFKKSHGIGAETFGVRLLQNVTATARNAHEYRYLSDILPSDVKLCSKNDATVLSISKDPK